MLNDWRFTLPSSLRKQHSFLCNTIQSHRLTPSCIRKLGLGKLIPAQTKRTILHYFSFRCLKICQTTVTSSKYCTDDRAEYKCTLLFLFAIIWQINRWDKPSSGITGETNALSKATSSTLYFSAFICWQSLTKLVTLSLGALHPCYLQTGSTII